MKICSRCKKSLPLSEFHKNKSFPDEHAYWCKSCKRTFARKYWNDLSEERKKERSKEKKEWKKQNPERVKIYKRKEYKNHPEKAKARSKVNKFIQRGLLIKSQHCQNCHEFAYVESHHYKGYAPEYALDVIWLCKKCHIQADKLKVG